MKIKQLYTSCLAEAAYYIESNGEAAIIDPLRETAPYLEMAEQNNTKIKYILETHFHADFVSGHVELAEKTGGTIVFGPTAQPGFPAYVAKDGEELEVGNLTIKVLHTPGHTMESSTFLLIDEEGKNHSIYTGDTLFIGDVGRPDLAVKSDLSREDLAGHLYDSLHHKILPLEDEVIVYPGHGAGSACGKNMSKETYDTLGNQKLFNYALQPMSKKVFIEKVTDGLTTPPQYFPKNAVLNKRGAESIDLVYTKGLKALALDEFERLTKEGALILDTRSQESFTKSFIPGALFIGIDGNFAPWVGALITDLKQPIVFIADKGREKEIITRLARVGYDNIQGYLNGGFENWLKAGKTTDHIENISAEAFADRMTHLTEEKVLDVRRQSEYDSHHVKNVDNFPLDHIYAHLNELDPEQTYYLHCAGGYRSVIAASVLKSKGFEQLINIEGGFKALEKTSLKLTEYVCPTTLL